MNKTLPQFKYHPNPITTGNVEESSEICVCCNQQRGFIYKASVYTAMRLEGKICPWCVADGSAAEKFDASFSDAHPLLTNGISEEIVEEVTKRTPGFISWQQEVWLSHCNDACEFHGDLEKEEAKKLDEKAMQKFSLDSELDIETCRDIIQHYQKGGNPAVYKFVCRHCGEVTLYSDFT